MQEKVFCFFPVAVNTMSAWRWCHKTSTDHEWKNKLSSRLRPTLPDRHLKVKLNTFVWCPVHQVADTQKPSPCPCWVYLTATTFQTANTRLWITYIRAPAHNVLLEKTGFWTSCWYIFPKNPLKWFRWHTNQTGGGSTSPDWQVAHPVRFMKTIIYLNIDHLIQCIKIHIQFMI